MRQKLLWCCALAGCCLKVSAGETEGIAIPPSIQALNVDVDGDGVASTADKLLLALWVQMGGDLEAALASATVTKDGLIQMGDLPQIAPGAEIEGSSDPVIPTSGGRGSAGLDFVTAVYDLYEGIQAEEVWPSQWIAAADLNNNGLVDLVVTKVYSRYVSQQLRWFHEIQILWNQGGGSFARSGGVHTGYNPESIAIGDFNGNGYNDIAVASQGDPSGYSVVVHWNLRGTLGSQMFGPYYPGEDPEIPIEGSISRIWGPRAQQCLLAADLNDNGQDELLLGYTGTSTPTYYHVDLYECNPNNNSFSGRNLESWEGPPWRGTWSFSMGNVDDEGDPDIALACGTAGLAGLNEFEFDWSNSPVYYPPPSGNFVPAKMDLGDLDGDGYADIVAVGGGDQMDIGLLANVAVDRSEPTDPCYADTGGIEFEDYPTSVVLSDLGGEDRLDIAVGMRGYDKTWIKLYRNTGTGSMGALATTFEDAGFVLFDEPYTSDILHIGTADLNGNEWNDLFGCTDNGFVVVALNVTGLLKDFRRGDANSDGKVDISDAVFLLAYLQAGGPAPGCMDAGDVNDDGQIDIADPVWLLSYVFASGPPPEPPFPGCGRDPTPDNLTCDVYDEALCGEL